MEAVILCIAAFSLGMTAEWFRERKYRRLLKRIAITTNFGKFLAKDSEVLTFWYVPHIIGSYRFSKGH